MKHRHSQMPLPPAEVGQISEELELREEQELSLIHISEPTRP